PSVAAEMPLAIWQSVHLSGSAEALQLQRDFASVAAAEAVHQLDEEFRTAFQCLAHADVLGGALIDDRRLWPPVIDVLRHAHGNGGIEANLADGAAFVDGVVEPR